MICDICGLETERRHILDLRKGIWCCPLCLRVYEQLWRYYSKKGYSRERCIIILRGVVERQKKEGKWGVHTVYNAASIEIRDDTRKGENR